MGNKYVSFDGKVNKVVEANIYGKETRANQYVTVENMPPNYKQLILLGSNEKYRSLLYLMKVGKLCHFFCMECTDDMLIIENAYDSNYSELYVCISSFYTNPKIKDMYCIITDKKLIYTYENTKKKLELGVMYKFKYVRNYMMHVDVLVDYEKMEYDEYDEDYYNPNNIAYVNGYLKL